MRLRLGMVSSMSDTKGTGRIFLHDRRTSSIRKFVWFRCRTCRVSNRQQLAFTTRLAHPRPDRTPKTFIRCGRGNPCGQTIRSCAYKCQRSPHQDRLFDRRTFNVRHVVAFGGSNRLVKSAHCMAFEASVARSVEAVVQCKIRL